MTEYSIIIVPGYTGSGPDHWQSHWQRERHGLTRVEQDDWMAPACGAWVDRLDAAIGDADHPVILVAHSLGCLTVVHWANARAGDVRGALLVAPTDPESPGYDVPAPDFAPVPLVPLPFPSTVVCSANDPLVSADRGRTFAAAWGSEFVDAGPAGHLNTASGHGPWPEGLALLDRLLAMV